VLVVLLVAALNPAARAAPIDEKQAEAARIQDELERQGEEVSVAAERFNQAQRHLEATQAALAKAEAELRRSDERMTLVRGRLAQAAVIAYTGGGSNAFLNLLARNADPTQTVVRQQYLRVIASDQRAVLGELRLAREDFEVQRSALGDEQRKADVAAAAAADTRADAMAAEAGQRTIAARIDAELADLVVAEATRRLEAEAALRPAPPVSTAPPAPTAGTARVPESLADPSPLAAPAGSSPAAIAVQEATRQIGKPYAWGGSGPDSFDCSGLTAWAWRAAGVELTHSADIQYFETTRVAVEDIQPGDLLFFGPDVEGIHHNAIYIGDGQMIEASQSGVPVRYRGWRARDLVGVGRPG
jgi:peptidoglycan DL-endopeptidase CwlO